MQEVLRFRHDDCTSCNSMNKFQKYAVGAVRRAANQNPTIAGGNRTITLSADSRPYSDSSRWYEFAQAFQYRKSLLPFISQGYALPASLFMV